MAEGKEKNQSRGEHLESVNRLKCLRAVPLALFVAAAALWVAPGAGAAITSSQVSAPASPTFSIFNREAPATFAVTGTATGAAVGEKVDLRCYRNALASQQLQANVAVAANGSFSAPAVSAETATDENCVLRAVPAGTEPTELAPFTGPVLATGESETFFTEGDVNEGMPYDLYLNGQQLTAADDYDSIGDCGLADSYLRNAEFQQIATFFCNDFYESRNGTGQPAGSGFRVDAANAYFSAAANQINDEANGFPSLAYGYTQNPNNGDLTISDGESPAICPIAAYPPNAGTCEEFLPSGVRDERTIEQTHDGHLVMITDSLASTDGKAHTVEALPENEQNFNQHGEEIEYKFPGESGYAPRVKGESIAFPSASVGAVYVKVVGAADGDMETGRGAILFFQPSSPAYFNEFNQGRNGFYFNNTATVPATGTATIRYAYAQAFTEAEVEALVNDATGALTPPPPTPPAPTPTVPTPSVSEPSAATASPNLVKQATGTRPSPKKAIFRIRKVQHFKADGTLNMRVVVTGPGRLSLTGKRVASVSRRATRKSSTFLAVTPTAALEELMIERGVVHVTVEVKFAPDRGSSRVKVKKMRLAMNE
jgi:hypothetical protein